MPNKIIYTNPAGSSFIEVPDGSLLTEIASRNRSGDFFGLSDWLPNPSKLFESAAIRLEELSGLLEDAHIGGAVERRKASVLKLSWQLNTSEMKEKDAAGLPIGVVEIEQRLRKLGLRKVIQGFLNGSLYGFQPGEIVWRFEGLGFWPKKIAIRPVKDFRYSRNDGALLYIGGKYGFNGRRFDPRKFLVAQHDATDDNPYGVAVLERCWWPAFFKKGGLKLLIRYIEKYGTPWTVGKYPARGSAGGWDATKIAAFVATLDGLIQDGVLAHPDDTSVEVSSASQSGSSELYLGVMDWLDSQCSKTLLGHTGATDATPGQLGQNNAAVEATADIVESDKTMIEEVINTLIDWMYSYNFATTERPRFELFRADDVDMPLAQRDTELKNQGVQFRKSYYKKAHKLADDDFDIVQPQPTGGTFSANSSTLGVSQTLGSLLQLPETSTFRDQRLVDMFAGQATDPARVQAMLEEKLAPLFKLAEKAGSFEALQKQLGTLFPEIDSRVLTADLQRALFFAEIAGRLEAESESGEIPEAEIVE